MSGVLRIFVCLTVMCMIPSLTQSQRLRFPSEFEVDVALNNPDTVNKALRCIEGFPCKLPYGRLLKAAGPDLMVLGRCPRRMCTREQEVQARRLILEIQQKYPKRFTNTYRNLITRRPVG